jgi:hypothetical protein
MNRDRLISIGLLAVAVLVVVAVEVQIRQIVRDIIALVGPDPEPTPTPEEAGEVIRRAEEITKGEA